MATIDTKILNILLDNGMKKEDAEIVAEKILTREEAAKMLVTKADIEAAFNTQSKWIAGMMVAQAALILAIMQILIG